MRIGIYGGSFDPPHKGHLHAALQFYDSLSLDLLLVIPDHTPPHKQLSGIDRTAARLILTRLCFSPAAIGNRRIEVSDFEIRNGGISYTALTLRHFHERYPEDTLYLLCGSDMFLTLGSWYQPETIFALSTPVLMRRETDPALTRQITAQKEQYREIFHRDCPVMDAPPFPCSSSEIRALLQNGGAAEESLTEPVAACIANWGLYQEDRMLALLREAILPIEGASRAAHSLAVEKECLFLAERFSLSPADCLRLRIAALLHDLTHRFSPEEHRELLLRHSYSEEETAALLRSPKTVHQTTGPLLLCERFPHVSDPVILSAIGCHTTGKPDMTLPDMLLCLADYMEETRPYPACKAARERFHTALANADSPEEKEQALTSAMLSYLTDTVRHVEAQNGYLDPMTLAALEDFLKKSKK